MSCAANPASGDKVTRWRPFAAQAEAGNVEVLRAAWNREWFEELASAPCSTHDDQADSVAGAALEPGRLPVSQSVARQVSASLGAVHRRCSSRKTTRFARS